MPSDINIVLWGPPEAGKTAFLAQLFLRHQAVAGGWDIFPTLESQEFIKEVRKDINMNHFPPPTKPETVRNIRYQFKNSKTGSEATLFVEDRAGLHSLHLDEEGTNRLNAAHGLILLFDPMRNPIELEEQISWTLSELHVAANAGTARDARPIAVCLSKADQKIATPEDLRRARENPRGFVLEKISADIVKWVEKLCSNFEMFPVSSLGVRVRHGLVEPMVFYDEKAEARIASGCEPLNLIEPLAWLFSKLELEGVRTQ
jgi:Double-GTPase 1